MCIFVLEAQRFRRRGCGPGSQAKCVCSQVPLRRLFAALPAPWMPFSSQAFEFLPIQHNCISPIMAEHLFIYLRKFLYIFLWVCLFKSLACFFFFPIEFPLCFFPWVFKSSFSALGIITLSMRCVLQLLSASLLPLDFSDYGFCHAEDFSPCCQTCQVFITGCGFEIRQKTLPYIHVSEALPMISSSSWVVFIFYV